MQAHRSQPAHAPSRQEGVGHRRKLLFVGRGNVANSEAVLRLFDVREVQIIGRTASPIDVLRRLEAGDAIDVVLLGPEWEEASSLFVQHARACGFAGSILCLMLTPKQPAPPNPRSKRRYAGASVEDRRRSTDLSETPRDVFTRLVTKPAQIATLDESHGSKPLTERQWIVLKRVSDGWTSKRIAQSLKCSEGAVKATLQHLFRKLGVRKRVLLARMISEGAIPAPRVR